MVATPARAGGLDIVQGVSPIMIASAAFALRLLQGRIG